MLQKCCKSAACKWSSFWGMIGPRPPVRAQYDSGKVYFDDGDAVDLGDDMETTRQQMDRLETGGFDKYQAYLDDAQLNLEVSAG